MSWNNVIPWYIFDIRLEKEQAMMLGAMAEELNAGWVRSYPEQWIEIDLMWERNEDRKLFSLGVDLHP